MQIISIPDENHLLLQLAIGVQLWTYFIVKVQQLLEGLALGRHNESDDMHEQLWHRIAIEHYSEDALHGLLLALICALLQLVAQLL